MDSKATAVAFLDEFTTMLNSPMMSSMISGLSAPLKQIIFEFQLATPEKKSKLTEFFSSNSMEVGLFEMRNKFMNKELGNKEYFALTPYKADQLSTLLLEESSQYYYYEVLLICYPEYKKCPATSEMVFAGRNVDLPTKQQVLDWIKKYPTLPFLYKIDKPNKMNQACAAVFSEELKPPPDIEISPHTYRMFPGGHTFQGAVEDEQKVGVWGRIISPAGMVFEG